jgi:tryptophan synthase alpha subunit
MPLNGLPTRSKSRLSTAIQEANQKNRLGLVVYIIPGFPNLETYLDLKEMLEQRECVSILETTIPVHGDFATASPTIIHAHLEANHALRGNTSPELLATQKPSFMVLYRQTYQEMGIVNFLQRYASVIDGITLEWDDPHFIRQNFKSLNQFEVEFITGTYSNMALSEVENALEYATQDGLIYLGCASITGGPMSAQSDIQAGARKIKTVRPHATIAAGMGIKTADDIRALAQIQQVDAVVVGTSFLQRAAQGVTQAEIFLNEIEAALGR